MNKISKIEQYEKYLAYFFNHDDYKIVCFGVSKALKLTFNLLEKYDITVDFICDNDQMKHDTIIENHKVYNPDKLFKLNTKFVVVISSMYSPQIKEQLKKYNNIILAEYYLHMLSSDINISMLNDKINIRHSKSTYKVDRNISVISDKILTQQTFEVIKSYGITKILLSPHTNYNKNYLDYVSYCNSIIARDDPDDILILMNTKYNFNEIYYRRLLEYFLLSKCEKIQNKEIIIEPLDLLLHGTLLDTTEKVLESLSIEKLKLVESTQVQKRYNNNALIIHLYYMDMFDELVSEIKDSAEIFDIYISVNLDATIEEINYIISVYPKIRIFIFENRGRDVLPFLKIFKNLSLLGYETICKVHSKKSKHNDNGIEWGRKLRRRLFDSYKEILENFVENPNIGGYVANGNLMHSSTGIGVNRDNIEEISSVLNIRFTDEFTFCAGTMFWCKTEAIRQLSSELLKSKYFSIEEGATDGNMEHAIERVIGLLVQENGYILEEV